MRGNIIGCLYSVLAGACALAAGIAPAMVPAMAPAWAQQEDTAISRPVPRYESLKFDEVNARIGPSFDHPVQWIYRREGVPVRVVMETEHWCKIQDPDGIESWVNRRTLSHRRTVMVNPEAEDLIPVYAQNPRQHGATEHQPEPVAHVTAGVILELGSCVHGYCRIDHQALRRPAWITTSAIWGVGSTDRNPLLASLEH